MQFSPDRKDRKEVVYPSAPFMGGDRLLSESGYAFTAAMFRRLPQLSYNSLNPRRKGESVELKDALVTLGPLQAFEAIDPQTRQVVLKPGVFLQRQADTRAEHIGMVCKVFRSIDLVLIVVFDESEVLFVSNSLRKTGDAFVPTYAKAEPGMLVKCFGSSTRGFSGQLIDRKELGNDELGELGERYWIEKAIPVLFEGDDNSAVGDCVGVYLNSEMEVTGFHVSAQYIAVTKGVQSVPIRRWAWMIPASAVAQEVPGYFSTFSTKPVKMGTRQYEPLSADDYAGALKQLWVDEECMSIDVAAVRRDGRVIQLRGPQQRKRVVAALALVASRY